MVKYYRLFTVILGQKEHINVKLESELLHYREMLPVKKHLKMYFLKQIKWWCG